MGRVYCCYDPYYVDFQKKGMTNDVALYFATQLYLFWFDFAMPLIGVRLIYMALYDRT